MGTPVPSTAAAPDRMKSIDAVRGLAMVLMALDHVRDFFSHDSLLYSPTNLDRASASVFLTRWITNFCAPAFVLLTGTGAFLWAEKGKSRSELSRFLLTRGLWLIFLELTVIRCLGWYFNFNYHDVPGTVIWAIGWSMILLAGLIHLPRPALATLAIALIAAHNLGDDVDSSTFGPLGWVWAILHSGDTLSLLPGVDFRPQYPLMPWIGVMALGYVCGPWMSPRFAQRQRLFWQVGVVLILAFVVLRAVNVYGDPSPWSVRQSPLFTFLDFINCRKYPPSLLYLLMTLGPTFLLLAWFEYRAQAVPGALVTLGRVPLFFYLVHLPLIHALAVVYSLVQFGGANWLFEEPPWAADCSDFYPETYGFGLAGVYLMWGVVLALLWPSCRWFADLKRRRRAWWLSYL